MQIPCNYLFAIVSSLCSTHMCIITSIFCFATLSHPPQTSFVTPFTYFILPPYYLLHYFTCLSLLLFTLICPSPRCLFHYANCLSCHPLLSTTQNIHLPSIFTYFATIFFFKYLLPTFFTIRLLCYYVYFELTFTQYYPLCKCGHVVLSTSLASKHF